MSTAAPLEEGNGIGKKLLVIGCIAALLLYFFIDSGNDSSALSKAPQTEPQEKTFSLGDTVAALDSEAKLTLMDDDIKNMKTDISTLGNELARNSESVEAKFAKLTADFKTGMDNQSRELTSVIDEIKTEQDRRLTSQFSENSQTSIGGVLFDDAGGISTQNQSTPSRQAQINTSRPSDSTVIFFGSRNIPGVQPEIDSAKNELTSILGGEAESKPSPSGNNQKSTSTKSGNKNDVPEGSEKITINAISIVDAVMFHGISCPILGGLESATGGFPPASIALQVRGIFREANGDTTDLGPLHMAGICTGQRTSDGDYGIGNITITDLSFNDPVTKEAVYINDVSAYALDATSKENFEMEGIRGVVDKASSASLAESSMSAALAVIGAGFRATQTTVVKDLASGTESSSFTGDPLKDILSQGIGGYFLELHDFYKKLRDSSVDTVKIPSGTRIRIVTKKPIEIIRKKPGIDVFDNRGDQNVFM